MPHFGPLGRADLIRFLRVLGFEGPIAGGGHEYMIKGTLRLAIPNPHHGAVIGRALLSRILREAKIDRDTWERL